MLLYDYRHPTVELVQYQHPDASILPQQHDSGYAPNAGSLNRSLSLQSEESSSSIMSIGVSDAGSLPLAWSSMSNLSYANFSGNSLTGAQAPLRYLLAVSLAALTAAGSGPTHLLPVKTLAWIAGSIPSSWSKLSCLQFLDLSDNNLTGRLSLRSSHQLTPAMSAFGSANSA